MSALSVRSRASEMDEGRTNVVSIDGFWRRLVPQTNILEPPLVSGGDLLSSYRSHNQSLVYLAEIRANPWSWCFGRDAVSGRPFQSIVGILAGHSRAIRTITCLLRHGVCLEDINEGWRRGGLKN